MVTISDGMVICLDYTLRLEGEDDVVDTSDGREPLQFVAGQGQIIPGLEKALMGMTIGEEKQVLVQPADGYGEMNSDLFETLERSAFPADFALELGMGLRMRTETGRTVIAYVHEMSEDKVVMNLNHPLAGKTLQFDVRIADAREATDEDLVGSSCGSCGSCDSCGDGGCGNDGCGDGCCN